MTLQEVCAILNISENTIISNFRRTQINLQKRGIVLTKETKNQINEYFIEEIPPTFIIYLHRNKINNKVYIGQTKQSPQSRWRLNGKGYSHSPHFYAAIQKYGWDNFDHIILETNLSAEEANEREQYWIDYYKSQDKEYGYNIQSGGKNYKWSLEARQKMSERFQGENGSFYGKKHTQEYKEKMSQLMKQKWADKEYRQKASNSMKEHHADVSGGKNKQAKKVQRIDTGEIFSCCGEAALSINKDWVQGGKNIARCCRGERKTAYSLQWKYIDKKEE